MYIIISLQTTWKMILNFWSPLRQVDSKWQKENTPTAYR